MRIFLSLISLCFMISCLSLRKSAPAFSGDKQHVVLLIDIGIDPENEFFKGKTLATYTLKCQEDENDLEKYLKFSDFHSLKKALLEDLEKSITKESPSDCSFVEGIKPIHKSNQKIADYLQQIQALKVSWNKAIIDRNFFDFSNSQITSINSFLSEFHGTNTGSVISYKNPKVKFVLIENKNISGGGPVEEKKVTCPTQAALDLLVQVMEDEEVSSTFNKVPNIMRKKRLSIIEQHKVSLVNKSYGGHHVYVERYYQFHNCGKLDFSKLLAAHSSLDQKRNRAQNLSHDHLDMLTIRSAGNEGLKISSDLDIPGCGSKGKKTLHIGSYTYDQRISPFSNYGSCVNYFTLGSQVVTSSVQNFLAISDGTSFSAPLALRYISLLWKKSMTSEDVLRVLESNKNVKNFFPVNSFPQETAYDDRKKVQFRLAHERSKKQKKDRGTRYSLKNFLYSPL